MISSALVVENMEMVHDCIKYSELSFFISVAAESKKKTNQNLSKLFSFIVVGKIVPQREHFCLEGI